MNEKTTGQKAIGVIGYILAIIGVILAAFISSILGLAKNS